MDVMFSDRTKASVSDLQAARRERLRTRLSATDVPPRRNQVARQLVHKLNPDEVFLTGWECIGPDEFEATAQWPVRHEFYSVADGSMPDLMLMAEVMRQAVVLTAHRGYDVAPSSAMLMKSLELDVEFAGLRFGSADPAITMILTPHHIKRVRSALKSMIVDVTFVQDGLPVATGRGDLGVMDQEVYRRVRQDACPAESIPTPGISRHEVERDRDRDVVLSATDTGGLTLRVDTRHPIFFDHPLDHIPGMLLLEAARQAATRVLGGASSFGGFEATFDRYVEFGADCSVSVSDSPMSGAATISFQQFGNVVASVTLQRRELSLRLAA